MADLLIADANNAHPIDNFSAYAKFSPVLIAKMTEGASYVAPSFVHHRAGAVQAKLRAYGGYHFWRDGIDPDTQADLAVRTFGTLRDSPLEWLILDVEGGTDFAAYERFCRRADAALGRTTWLYGGKQLRGHTNGRPLWVARYYDHTPSPAGQPNVGEKLWQFTDRYPVPGLRGGGDCSVFRGTITQFMALLRGGSIVATLDGDDIKAIGAEVSRQLSAVFTGSGQTTDEASWDRLYDNSLDAALSLRDIKAAVDRLTAGGGTLDLVALAKELAPLVAADLAKRLAT